MWQLHGRIKKLNFYGILSVWLLCSLVGFSWAEQKVEYKDVYLTENRVCKACRVEWADKTHLKLVNRAGLASLVEPKEILGIDRHPVVRQALIHSLYGIGLPGPIIVPAAFEDGNDYVCKYCDTFNK